MTSVGAAVPCDVNRLIKVVHYLIVAKNVLMGGGTPGSGLV